MSTIADVAREANVSVATVSRVLNNQDSVRPETSERVYRAIEKLAFVPNMSARNLRRNETRVILIVTPNITNPYYAHILTGIGDGANESGYSALIYNTAGDETREKAALDMLKKRKADGAILLASNIDSLWIKEYSDSFPIVQCSEYALELDAPRVSIDNYKAAQDIMEYIIGLGHKRIATISSSNNYISTALRLQGYKDSLERHDIEVCKDYIASANADYSFKSGKAAAFKLLQQKSRPTAIFCISDTIALGAITAAKELGLRVPEDLTVIGFDDVDDTTMFHPYITTIAQPCYELGKESFRILHLCMNNGKETNKKVILPHDFIIRESSASFH
ncbi:MAG: LacI family DNA-binding transcriptional regulator [Caulobacteraceae bacterium]